MPKFSDCSQMIDFLQKEASEKTRFPIRFILIKGLKAWRDVINILNFEVNEVIRLSSLCQDDDVFPFLEDLLPLIEKFKDKKIAILPLAECLRFDNERSSILRELASWQSVGYGRVYIPLLDIEDIYEQEMNVLPRFRDGEIPQAWAVKGDDNVELRILPFEIKDWTCVTIKGIKAYLKTWEKGGQYQLCLVTRYAPYLKERMSNFAVRVCRNSFETIIQISQDVPEIKKEWGKEHQWQWLAQEMNWQENFNDMVARILNVHNYDVLHLFTLWNTFDENKRWLLWLWSKVQIGSESYLQRVLKECNDYNQFVEGVVNGGFYGQLDVSLLKERKTLLEYMKLKEMPATYWQQVLELQNPLEKLKSLTGITDQEKEAIVLAVKDLLETNKEKETWWPFLEICYPELSYYLSPYDYKDETISNYFNLYTFSRILDSPKKELLRLASHFSKQKKFWEFPTRDSLLEKYQDQGYIIYWIDGMGLEWVGLIKGLLKQEGINLKIEVARANLPTTTKSNKGWTAEKEVERGIDDTAHKYNYSFPSSLINQLDIIKKVVERTALLINQNKNVIITSDHGLTRFASQGEKISPPKGAQVHKWGRFAILNDNSTQEEFQDLPCLIDGDKVILTVHNIFSGGSGTSREVHGGATLEESLVPVIKLYKLEDKVSSRPNFKISDNRIKLNAKGEGYLIITAQVRLISLRVSGKIFYGASTKGTNKWKIYITGLKAGEHLGILEYEDGYLGEVKFKLVKGLVEDDMGL